MVSRIGAPYFAAQPFPPAWETKEKEGALSFGELLQQAFDSVNRAQWDAELAAQRLATGEIEDIHQVTILAEKASLSLQLMIAIRNKVIERTKRLAGCKSDFFPIENSRSRAAGPWGSGGGACGMQSLVRGWM